MIDLQQNTFLVRYFVWSCDHLPLTGTTDYTKGGEGERRYGSHYIETGTTLCHLFWVVLWMPMIVAAFSAAVAVMLALVQISAYENHRAKLGIAAFFIPEFIIMGAAAAIGLIILIVFGAGKSGFMKMLWLYLKSIKHRICPLIRFNVANREIEEGEG